MGQYLIDNNVISTYFSGLFSEKGMDFIAATAIVHNFTLITSDTDFNNIQGLQVIDPHTV